MQKSLSHRLTRLPSEIIQQRSSWRSCTGEPIPHAKRQQLERFIAERSEGIFGTPLRFQLVAARSGDSAELSGLGTYGFIRGASGFIVGALKKELNNLEDYGLLMEEIILYATDLDLATCWLGGSFQKDNFSARIHTQEDEIVPAVVSVGLHADHRNMVDRIIRNVAGSKKRLDWDRLFFEPDLQTPLDRERAGSYAPVFDMVRLSPSASNKQPWRLVLEGDTIHFFLKRTPGYHKPKLFSDLQRIDMGISMCHFEQVCLEMNLPGSWIREEPQLDFPDFWEYTASWSGRKT